MNLSKTLIIITLIICITCLLYGFFISPTIYTYSKSQIVEDKLYTIRTNKITGRNQILYNGTWISIEKYYDYVAQIKEDIILDQIQDIKDTINKYYSVIDDEKKLNVLKDLIVNGSLDVENSELKEVFSKWEIIKITRSGLSSEEYITNQIDALNKTQEELEKKITTTD